MERAFYAPRKYVSDVWEGKVSYLAKIHAYNNLVLCLQPGILGILLGLECGMIRDCAREVSLAQVSCILMYICYVAPPTLVGACSYLFVRLFL